MRNSGFILTALIYLLSFFCTALVSNRVIQHGFGRSDVWPLLFWGMPGFLLNSFIINVASEKINFKRKFFNLLIRIVVAISCGYVANAIYSILLGVWSRSFSISSFLPSLAAALSAAFIPPVIRADGRARLVKSGAIFVMMVLIFSIGIPICSSLFMAKVLKGGRVLTASIALGEPGSPVDAQKTTLAYCPHGSFEESEGNGSESPHSGGYLLQFPCSAESLKTLLNFHQTVQVPLKKGWLSISEKFAQYGHVGSGVLLAFRPETHFPKSGLELNLPDQTSVIYFQSARGWEVFPKEAKLTSRKMKLILRYQENSDGTQTPFLCTSLEDVDGRFEGPDCGDVLPDGVRLIIE